jgi:hypothetical protein
MYIAIDETDTDLPDILTSVGAAPAADGPMDGVDGPGTNAVPSDVRDALERAWR